MITRFLYLKEAKKETMQRPHLDDPTSQQWPEQKIAYKHLCVRRGELERDDEMCECVMYIHVYELDLMYITQRV